jgi:hypothetical protein
MESASSQAPRIQLDQASSPDPDQTQAQAQASAEDSQEETNTRHTAVYNHDQTLDDDHELPDGDLTQTAYWPRAPATMIDKSDIIMAQNEVILKSTHLNNQKAEERYKIV